MIINIFHKHVKETPDKIALIVDQSQLTYRELAQQVAAFSATLETMGVKKGSHIALILNNSVEFLVVMLSAARLGSVIVPLNIALKSNFILKAIQASDSKFVIATRHHLKSTLSSGDIYKKNSICLDDNEEGILTYAKAIENFPQAKLTVMPLTGDEHFILTMTSGSTGDPKPIIFSQNTKITRAYSARDCYHLDDSIVSLAATPLYHSLAQRLVLLPLLLGGTTVIMKHFKPKLWLDAVSNHEVTFSIPVSSQLANIITEYNQGKYNVSSLRTLVSSSALISQELKEKLIDTFDCEIHEIYGASEVGVVTNLAPTDSKKKLGTVGKALPVIDLKIVDDEGKTLPIGEKGEITCKTPSSFIGYYKRPDETAKAIVSGYFHTGDLGKLDKDGFLTFMGRKKDIIITGGINVYPEDIEKVLMESDLLKECAVIDVKDIHFGETVLAVIVVKDPRNFNLRGLQILCMKKLADYQQPLGYEILDELPKNSMGKIMKPELRLQFKGLDLTKKLRSIIKI
jgi:long-chain acyl-CoA synthetase